MGNKASTSASPSDPAVRKAAADYRSVQATRSQVERQAFINTLTAQEKGRQTDLANIVKIMQGYRQTILDRLSAGERVTYLPEFNCYSVDYLRKSHELFAAAIEIVFGNNSGINFVPTQELLKGTHHAPYVIFL